MNSVADLPLVSIVTPSYNQAAFLEDTLRSVFRQDYPNLEFLVVDGASTDGSVEIIRRYADRLAWWVSEKDSGQAEAINKGLRRTQGEIVAWLNSDDLYLPGAIAQAVAALQAHPEAGFVYTDAVTIDTQGRPLNRLAFGDWGLEELMRFRIICQPAVFMRRSVLMQAGELDPSYHFLLDHHLWLRLATIAPAVHITATPAAPHCPPLWAAARHHPGAKNVAQAAGFGREAFRILDWMETQRVLARRLKSDRRRILAGAHRLNARYLLDGGQPGPALRAYLQALAGSPPYALQHWRRMLFALAGVMGAKTLAARFAARQTHTPPDLSAIPGIQGWPGIQLSESKASHQP